MKSCLSVLLVMILTPLLSFAIYVQIFDSSVFNEVSYNEIFTKSNVQQESIDFFKLRIENIINSKLSGSNAFLKTPELNTTLDVFLSKLHVSQVFPQTINQFIGFIKGTKDNANIIINLNFSTVDIDALKVDLTNVISKYLTTLPNCTVDDIFNKSLSLNSFPTCNPSIIPRPIVNTGIRLLLDRSVDYDNLKSSLNTTVILDNNTNSNLIYIKNVYSLLKNIITLSWLAVSIICILLVIINLIKEITFAGYFSKLGFFLALGLAINGVILQFLLYPHIDISSSSLNLSGSYNIDEANALTSLFNNLLRELTQKIYITFYVYAGIFFFIFIVFLVMNIIIKGLSQRSENKLVQSNYYIPAYSNKDTQPVNSISEVKENYVYDGTTEEFDAARSSVLRPESKIHVNDTSITNFYEDKNVKKADDSK